MGTRRFRLVVMLLCIAMVALALLIYLKWTPLVESLAVTQVENEASDMISEAINEQIANGNIDYDRIIALDKDATGNITALQTDMAEVNRLRRELSELINEKIMDINIAQLGIPVGNVLLPSIFSGLGPKIPIQVTSVNNASTDFSSSFTQAGINQTLHQISVTVSMDITVLVAGGTRTTTISQDMVVAQTVIVGTVPNSWIQTGT